MYDMAAPVQAVGNRSGTQNIDPIAEAGQWKAGLKERFDATRVDGAIKPALVHQAAFQSMIAPTAAGVPLRDLPIEVAQEMLNARSAAMKEFFDGWAESIRKNAEADKKAAFRGMLKSAREKALENSRRWLTGKRASTPNPTSTNREPELLASNAPGKQQPFQGVFNDVGAAGGFTLRS